MEIPDIPLDDSEGAHQWMQEREVHWNRTEGIIAKVMANVGERKSVR